MANWIHMLAPGVTLRSPVLTSPLVYGALVSVTTDLSREPRVEAACIGGGVSTSTGWDGMGWDYQSGFCVL